jgi:hypothetical protein
LKAIALVPGRPETAGVIELAEPPASDGLLLVRTLLIGMCGTDREIAEDGYGVPPPGEERLVLGHESRRSGTGRRRSRSDPRSLSRRCRSAPRTARLPLSDGCGAIAGSGTLLLRTNGRRLR